MFSGFDEVDSVISNSLFIIVEKSMGESASCWELSIIDNTDWAGSPRGSLCVLSSELCSFALAPSSGSFRLESYGKLKKLPFRRYDACSTSCLIGVIDKPGPNIRLFSMDVSNNLKKIFVRNGRLSSWHAIFSYL